MISTSHNLAGGSRSIAPPLWLTVLILSCLSVHCGGPAYADSTNWAVSTGVMDWGFRGLLIGADTSAVDGYEGQNPYYPPADKVGAAVMLYRETGPRWSGPTAFYAVDKIPPLAAGESYTWNDIYLWAQNFTVPGGVGQMEIVQYYPAPPTYYYGQIVLDYVPSYLNWTGPSTFAFNLRDGALIDLPIPTVTNPLDGVRMHLTVYAGPIPEPSSLLALAVPLAGLMVVRRRRRR